MYSIYLELKSFFKIDFQKNWYFFTAIFITLSIALNYTFHIKKEIIQSETSYYIRTIYYIIFYSIAYYIPLISGLYFAKELKRLKQFGLWLWSILAIIALSTAQAFPFQSFLAADYSTDIYIFYLKIYSHLKFFCFYIFVCFLFLLFESKKDKSYLGIYGNKINLKPFLLVIFLFLPFIFAASFLSDFQKMYPTFKEIPENSNYLNVAKNIPTFIYELLYGLHYFGVEFLFRGLLVIGLVHLLGSKAVVPMVSFYVFIHFGKPAGETISSVFGGYILGALAYRWRNIWGGVIAHIGIAWSMDLIPKLIFLIKL